MSMHFFLSLKTYFAIFEHASKYSNAEINTALLEYKNKNYSAAQIKKNASDNLDKALGLKKLTVADMKKLFNYYVSEDKATITEYKGDENVVVFPEYIGKAKVVAIRCNTRGWQYIKVFKNNSENITSVVIPSTVEEIGEETFMNCINLTSISIPNSVQKIGAFAFKGCKSLKEIKLPNSVKEIGRKAFEGCSGLESIKIPSSVGEIGDYTFENCINLTSVTLPNKAINLGRVMFLGCNNLKSIEIPPKCKNIGTFLELCPGLTEVKIPDTVKEIDPVAFHTCTNLEKVEIPSSVKIIGRHAFCKCTSLKSIEIPNSVEEIHENAFEDCQNLRSITVAEDNKNFASIDGDLYTKDGKTLIFKCSGK